MTLSVIAALFSLTYWLNSSPSQVPLTPTPPERFRALLVDIRTMAITPYEAEKRFQAIMRELHRTYLPARTDSVDVQLIFPLRGKNYRAVGGNGSGFRARGFDLFDHTVSGSHPAHDIFIYDRDRDCIEDTSGEYVDVVAVSGGVVIAREMDWNGDMDFRGGNYVWVYDFQTGGIWYYAHLRKVNVHPGQLVQAGDVMGEVGRTGFNAATNRSDTHLHLMHLALDSQELPRPVDTYGWLKKARTVYKPQIPLYVRPRIMISVEKATKLMYRPIPGHIAFPVIKKVRISDEQKSMPVNSTKPKRKGRSLPWKI